MASINQNVFDVKSLEEHEKILENAGRQLVVVYFWASWSAECKQMDDVILELAKEFIHPKFIKVEAEEVPEVTQNYEIAFVPTVLLMKSKKVIDRVDGANAPELSKKVQHHATSFVAPVTIDAHSNNDSTEDLNDKLKRLINAAPCMLFMKGSPSEPRCGFSRTIVGILSNHNIKYNHFDILSDERVRQGLKKYSNWPTYPQLYSNGELIGGLDIVKELADNGELEQLLPKSEDLNTSFQNTTIIHQQLVAMLRGYMRFVYTVKRILWQCFELTIDVRPLKLKQKIQVIRLGKLIHQAPIMLFMKGSPEAPQCKFSRALIEILKTTSAKYSHFDILQDNEVREGLKKFSNWPTYPQIYVNGELVGGLDIIKELHQSGELMSTLSTGS